MKTPLFGYGLGVAVYGRTTEEKILGITSIVGGIGATCSILTGVLAPKPAITIGTPFTKTTIAGELAIQSYVVQLTGLANVAGVAGGTIINGGYIFMIDDEEVGKLLDQYGGELYRDRVLDSKENPSTTLNFRVRMSEKRQLEELAQETKLSMTELIRLALKLLRDKLKDGQ